MFRATAPYHIHKEVVFIVRITQAFDRACRRAGIENLRFHDLRHEATSRLFEKGLNPMEVSTITGHKTLQRLKRDTHKSRRSGKVAGMTRCYRAASD